MTRSADLRLDAVGKRYGGRAALTDVTLDVPAGTYVVLLGPSGSGKTTLLSILGGFIAPSEGRVLIGKDDVTRTGPAQRPTATVFQDYALFPHLTVAGNVGFGLAVRGAAKAEIAARVEAMLTLVGLPDFGRRPIGAASGGQRQRIALARALAIDPAILLLDEPLGALDLALRRQMQDELKRLQRREGRTFVHVTHDQEEAMAIADLIVIMNDGRVEDMGSPQRVYQRPRTRFSAAFMGESTILPATRIAGGVAETELGPVPVIGDVGDAVAIRPETLRFEASEASLALAEVTVEEVVYQGSFARVRARRGDTEILARVAPATAPMVGARVPVHLDRPGAIRVI